MSRKTGRNDPCPCGSGKKFKRCCLGAAEAGLLEAVRQPALLDADDDVGGGSAEGGSDNRPVDYSAVELIGYTRGFAEDVDQIATGEGLRIAEWRAPHIPQELLDSLAHEGFDGLDGLWGDPEAAAPIQVDSIYLRAPDAEVIVEVCNRAHLLRTIGHPDHWRIHRVCSALEAAADRGVDPPDGVPDRPSAGPPAFTLDEALKAHRRQKGTCELCHEEVTGAGAGRHLAGCAPRHDATSGPAEDLIHLRVTAPGISGYWLDVGVRAGAPLSALDDFLRGIWVECCDHLSDFEIGGVEYASRPYDDPLGGMFRRRRRQHGLDVPIGKAIGRAVDRFTYRYDFGSTTRLQLVVRGTRAGRIGRDDLRLLARNQPLVWPCAACGAPAASMCVDCLHESGNPFACSSHAREHKCGEDAFRPISNSPRMGVCGYV